MKKEWRYQELLIKITIVFVFMLSVYFGIRYMLPMLYDVSGKFLYALMPFILAVIFSILIDPIVDWLVTKKDIKRGWAVAFVLIILILIVSLILIFVISRLAVELHALYQKYPFYSEDMTKYGMNIFESVKSFFFSNPLPLEVQNAMRNGIEEGLNGILSIIALSTNMLFSILTGLPALITIIIVSAIATFFVSRDKKSISSVMKRYVPGKYLKQLYVIKKELSLALTGFFRAQIILISITAIQTILGLYILGVDYALTIGIIVGFFDLLPVLGPGTVLIPWAIVKMIMGDLTFGIYLVILYVVLVGVRQVIEPKILSQSIGLHPLAILISMYLGLQIIGIFGLIIGPFLFILGKSLIISMKTNEG